MSSLKFKNKNNPGLDFELVELLIKYRKLRVVDWLGIPGGTGCLGCMGPKET